MSKEPPAFSINVQPGDVEDPLIAFKNNVDFLKKTVKTQMELNQTLAKIQKSKFDSLLREGFTPDQALFLIK